MKKNRKKIGLELNKRTIGTFQSTTIVGGSTPPWGSCPVSTCGNCTGDGATLMTCPPDPITTQPPPSG